MSKKDKKRRIRWAKEGYGSEPLCYLCGTAPATTDDHVPPRGFFATTRGSDAYELPACVACNGLLTDDEKYLRNVIATAGKNREASKVSETVWRSLQGSRPLYPFDNRKRLFRNLRLMTDVSPGGIIKGTRLTYDLDLERTLPVVTKITRGLHFKHTKISTATGYTFEPGYISPQDEKRVSDWVTSFNDETLVARGQIKGVLDYAGWYVQEDPQSSIWLLDFYESVPFQVFIAGPQFQSKQQEYQDLLVVNVEQPPLDQD